MNKKKQAIKIENLLVNPNNPRFHPVKTQEEAISVMLKEMKVKIKTLAKDIVDNGLNPGKFLLVLKASNRKYIVLDGNRRLTAIKLITNPNIVKLDQKTVQFFKKLKQQFHSPKTLDCIVFTTKEEANHWIKLEHTGENKGVGQVSWDAEQTARFQLQTSGSKRKHIPVLDFMRKNNITLPTKKATNIERLITTAGVTKNIGIKIQDQKISLLKDKPIVLNNLHKIVNAISLPGFSVRQIYKAEQIKKFIDRVLSDDKKTIVKIRKKNKTVNKTIFERGALIPKNFNLNIPKDKANLIYKELKALEVENFRNAVAVLFRVFLELSVNHYIKAKNINIKNNSPALYQKLQNIIEYMQKNNILTTDELKPINIASSKANKHSILSTETFNSYAHNLDHIPSVNDLKICWSHFQRFIEKLWM